MTFADFLRAGEPLGLKLTDFGPRPARPSEESPSSLRLVRETDPPRCASDLARYLSCLREETLRHMTAIEVNPTGRCSRCSENTSSVPDDDYGHVSVCCGWPLLPDDWEPPTAMERD